MSIESLNYIRDNIKLFYWMDSDSENQSVVFGAVDSSHMVFSFKDEEAFINLTLFEGNGSTRFAPNTFPLLVFKEHFHTIKEIVLTVNKLLSEKSLDENQTNNALNLMNFSSLFIKENFSKEKPFL